MTFMEGHKRRSLSEISLVGEKCELTIVIGVDFE